MARLLPSRKDMDTGTELVLGSPGKGNNRSPVFPYARDKSRLRPSNRLQIIEKHRVFFSTGPSRNARATFLSSASGMLGLYFCPSRQECSGYIFAPRVIPARPPFRKCIAVRPLTAISPSHSVCWFRWSKGWSPGSLPSWCSVVPGGGAKDEKGMHSG